MSFHHSAVSAALILVVANSVIAQDIGVRTEIFDEGAKKTGKPAARTPIGRSAALFHAGKVYDCVDSNRMTIFEPAQNRFVIIDGSARLLTVLPFDEIETALDQAAQHAEQDLADAERSGDHSRIKAAELLRFQLHPRFNERYIPADRRLELTSKVLSYTAQCETAGSPEVVQTYLQFADWAARLNYVVNRQAQLPGPRLELNQALLKRRVLPSKVTLKWQSSERQLTAEHRFHWKLDQHDRETILYWEQMLTARDFKRVTLEKLLDSQPAQGVSAKR